MTFPNLKSLEKIAVILMIAHSSSTFNQGFLGENPEGEGIRHIA